MKELNISRTVLCHCLWAVIAMVCFIACSDDEPVVKKEGAPVVDRVLVKSDGGEWTEPDEDRLIRIGEQIRIEGSGLADVLAVYCNGTHTSTFEEVSESYLVMTVPDGVKLEGAPEDAVNGNTLRVVTMNGKVDYTLYYTGKKIAVTETDAKREGHWVFGETTALIGEAVRLKGTGFTTDAEHITVWLNGVQVGALENPLDDRLTINIPGYIPFGDAVADESLKNTIRIRTKYDEYTYTGFTIEGRKGEVTRIVLEGQDVAIPAASYNDRICIEGKYIATASEVYCNGVKVENFEKGQDKIVLTVPEGLPVGGNVTNPEDRNKVRIVTAYDEPCTYDFIFRPYTPTVSAISNKMPVPGGYFYLEGQYLKEEYITAIRLGDADLTFEEVAGREGSVLKVTVPENVPCNHSCPLTIVSEDLEIVVEKYMCYAEGVFLRTFSKEEQGNVGNNQLATIYHTMESRPVSIDASLPCPEYVLSLGDGQKTLPTGGSAASETNFSFFRFSGADCFKRVMDNNSSLAATPLEDLPIQLEVYMNKPWTSGFLAWRFDKNGGSSSKKNSARTYNIMPWTNDTPFTFDYGWRTITIPFTSFTGMITTKVATLEDLYGELYTIGTKGSHAMLNMFNYDIQEDGRIYSSVENFQLNIANVRIVPIR